MSSERCLTDEQRELVARNLDLTRRIAGKSARRLKALERKDLEQEAAIGLIDAVVRFDPTKNVPLANYATHKMRSAILDLARRSGIVRLPRLNRGVIPKVVSLSRNFQSKNFDMTSDWRGGKSAVEDFLAQSHEEEPGRRLESAETFARWLAVLEPAEKRVIQNYYGDPPKTMLEIGRIMGLSENRVSQLHVGSLVKIRRWIQQLDSGSAPPPVPSPFVGMAMAEEGSDDLPAAPAYSITHLASVTFSEVARDVLRTLSVRPDSTLAQLVRRIGRSRNGTSQNLKSLVNCGLVSRPAPSYRRTYRIDPRAIAFIRHHLEKHGDAGLRDDFLAQLSDHHPQSQERPCLTRTSPTGPISTAAPGG